jgi:hypothetical protein
MKPALIAVATAFVVATASTAALAQPGPEHKKMEPMVGRFQVALDVKAAGSVPASKASGTETCEWFANLHVTCRIEATGAGGLYQAHHTVSYLPALKQYALYTVDSLGYASLSLGQVSGSTWTFSSEVAGYKFRTTMKPAGTGFTVTSEYAGADGKWTTSVVTTTSRAK